MGELQILICLALTGKQSKGTVESILKDKYHADIINAFNKLEQKQLIKKSGFKRYASGRRQHYYKITYDGLRLLIFEYPNIKPSRFWTLLFGFGYQCKNGLSSESIEGLTSYFYKSI